MTNEDLANPNQLQPKALMPENQQLIPGSPEYDERVRFLDVDDGYKVQYEIVGPLDSSVTIICSPGGPGGQYDQSHDFHPKGAKRVFVAPRGTDPGESPDKYGIERNTLDDKVEDMRKLMDELGVEKAILSGGSFGSAINLAFAAKYPERVEGMILWGVHTGLEEFFDEYISERAKEFAPAHYAKLIEDYQAEKGKEPEHYKDIVQFHRDRIFQTDENGLPTVEAKRSAAVYALWQLKLAQPPAENMDEATAFTYSLINNEDILSKEAEEIFDTFVNFGVKTSDELIKEAGQPLDYFANSSFMTPELDFRNHLDALRKILITIVAGTEDHNTPVNVARYVANMIGGDNIRLVELFGGHLRSDLVIQEALIRESASLVARAKAPAKNAD